MKKFSGFEKLDHKISKIIKPISKKKKENFVIVNNLRKNWKIIVGDKYYQYCYPQKVQLNTNNKTVLFIVAHNSGVAFALESKQNILLEKIASYFGYKIISAIRITQELKEISLQKKEKDLIIDEKDKNLISTTTKNIKDKDLQKILEKLGKFVFGKEN